MKMGCALFPSGTLSRIEPRYCTDWEKLNAATIETYDDFKIYYELDDGFDSG
jgi:hypothetical protein